MTTPAVETRLVRSWPRRALALALGLVLAPLVIELGLQLAALIVSGNRVEASASALVLCQGDSNTFGLNLPAEQAYPGQLEALLIDLPLSGREPGKGKGHGPESDRGRGTGTGTNRRGPGRLRAPCRRSIPCSSCSARSRSPRWSRRGCGCRCRSR
jgi:hypothetical protein